jgi:hypothetical protein
MEFSQVVEREQLARNQKGRLWGKQKSLETFLSTDQYKTETMTEENVCIQIKNPLSSYNKCLSMNSVAEKVHKF